MSLQEFTQYNAQQCKAAVDPQTKPTNLDCESAYRLLSSTLTIAIYYAKQRHSIQQNIYNDKTL